MRKILISGSILDADFSNLAAQVATAVKGGLDLLHFDIADTTFTPTISFGPKVVSSILKAVGVPGEAHLMVSSPMQLVQQLAGLDLTRIYFHVEATSTPYRVISKIKNIGADAGLVLNPSTSLSAVEYLLADVDSILVLLVEPGLGGQEMMDRLLNKVRALQLLKEKEGFKYSIAVDGGIKPHNVVEVARAGADIVVIGSAIFGSKDPLASVAGIREKLREAGFL
ncbi:MAG: ribulose-phosphate 3-epimerase [Thermofilaceae archaeon]